MNKIISWFQPNFWGNEKAYVLDSLESSWLSDGHYLNKFEKEFSKIVQTQNTITTSNGTTALYLALLAESITSNDEVIVPGYTFAAPINMILAAGGTPVYVDVDPNTWCISPLEVEKAITKKTKAIIPVHIYGNVCDMGSILEISKANNLEIIEDVAEAFLSKYNDQYAGTFGAFGCFSFQATKTITTGEGGAIVSNFSDKAQRARLIRNHGMTKEKRYWHHEVGHNFRLTNMQAALGLAQLEQINSISQSKIRVNDAYRECLKDLPGIQLQKIEKEVSAIIWAVAVKIDSAFFKGDRDYLVQALLAEGIETRPGFYSFDKMPIYNCKPLKNSISISENVISLPSYPTLTNDTICYICDKLKSFRK